MDGFYAKLVERSALEEDGDLDLYGIYASYLGIEDVVIDAYWIYLRDATAKNSVMRLRRQGFLDWRRVAITQGDVVDTHTFGLRGAGTLGAFDFEAEAAYQHIDIDNNDNDSDSWAANLELGYTFDTTCTPRISLGAAYFEDDDDDLAFNRLASDWEYSLIIDKLGILTGFWTLNAGVSAMVTECIELDLNVAYFEADEGTRNDDDEMGWEIDLCAVYDYSEDLSFEVGYAHFFTDDDDNALGLDDDLDYVYFETKLCF